MRFSVRAPAVTSAVVLRYVFCVIDGAGVMHDFAGTGAADEH